MRVRPAHLTVKVAFVSFIASVAWTAGSIVTSNYLWSSTALEKVRKAGR